MKKLSAILSYEPNSGVVIEENNERHVMPLLELSVVTGGAAVTRLVRYPTN